MNTEWTDAQSLMLLDMYEEYLPLFKPLKMLKIKRNMWNKIVGIINQELNGNKAALQPENRYKTIWKRKNACIHGSEESEVMRANAESPCKQKRKLWKQSKKYYGKCMTLDTIKNACGQWSPNTRNRFIIIKYCVVTCTI